MQPRTFAETTFSSPLTQLDKRKIVEVLQQLPAVKKQPPLFLPDDKKVVFEVGLLNRKDMDIFTAELKKRMQAVLPQQNVYVVFQGMIDPKHQGGRPPG